MTFTKCESIWGAKPMKKAKWTTKNILTCPYCGFEKPESNDGMAEREDIVSFEDGVYTCGCCNAEFRE